MEFRGTSVRLSDNVDQYCRSLQASGICAGTIRQRRALLARLGDHPTRADVEAIIAPLSPRTRRNYVATIRNAIAHMRDLGLWDGPDPTVGLRLPRAPAKPPRPLSERHVAWLLELKGNPYAWTILGLYAGLRASEAAAWKPEHVIDTLHGPGLLIPRGKGGKQSVIPAHPEVVALAGGAWSWRDWEGVKLSSIWRDAALRRGLPDSVRFHQLRHTYGTRWAARTGDLLLTRDLMRHASVTSTQIYTAVADDALWVAMRTATGERPVNDYPMAVRELQRSAGA